MRVLVISTNTERLSMTTLPLGAAIVASATRRQGHHVELLDLLLGDPDGAAVAGAIRRLEPDVIGVSVRNVDDQNLKAPTFLLDSARAVVAACRAASTAPVIVGGAGYSIFPVAALRYLGADLGVAGEGELAFPALLTALAEGRDPAGIPGVCTPLATTRPRRSPSVRLDDLASPYADLSGHLADPEPGLAIPVQSRRGCPFECSYCSTPAIEGHAVHWRSPALVVADLEPLAEAGVRRLHFVDNTFNLPERYALELCERLADLGAPFAWRAIVYPHRLRPELVEAMAAAGCDEVALGAESGSDPMLRLMGKRFTSADVRATSAAFRAAGISRTGFLLLGAPGETRDTVRESFDLVDELELEMLKITVGIRIYPDTPLAAAARREGVIAADDDLLQPRFYLAREVSGWIDDAVASHRFTARAVC